MQKKSALDRQRTVYLEGAAGRRQAIPFYPELLERRARLALRPEAFAYIAGGAGLEETVKSNAGDFNRWR
ncbi:MAG: hypothetical protein L6Q97_22590, partial [Thermoanaerobaculia bacterium]|nr:hypothetical protein [Thermoanaerobaculia bacterium]